MSHIIYPNFLTSLIDVGFYIFNLDTIATYYKDPFNLENILVFENIEIKNLICKDSYVGIFNSDNSKFYDNLLEEKQIVKNTISSLTYVEEMYIVVIYPYKLKDMIYLTLNVLNTKTFNVNFFPIYNEKIFSNFSGSISYDSKKITKKYFIYTFNLKNLQKFLQFGKNSFENMRIEKCSVIFIEMCINSKIIINIFKKVNDEKIFFLPKEPFPVLSFESVNFNIYCDKECLDITLQFDIPCSKTIFSKIQKITVWNLTYNFGRIIYDQEFHQEENKKDFEINYNSISRIIVK